MAADLLSPGRFSTGGTSADGGTRSGHPRDPRYIATLAIVAAAILLGGILLRPEPSEQRVAVPSDSDLLRLAHESQRQSLDDVAQYLTSVARDAQRFIVASPSGGSATVWPDGTLLTPRPASGIEESIAARPRPPLAARPYPDGIPPALRRAALLHTGEWLIAVWRMGPSAAHAAGHLTGIFAAECEGRAVHVMKTTTAIDRTMAGGGLFDLDGRLVAVIVPCADETLAVDAADVPALLDAGPETDDEPSLTTFGFTATAPSPDETAYFAPARGLLVRDVWQESRAAHAGLRPGDLVQTVAGQTVDTAQQLQGALSSAEEVVQIGVSRRGRSITLRLPPDVPPSNGLVWPATTGGSAIAFVQPGSPADRAGIRAGDLVLRVNHDEVRSAAALRRRFTGQSAAPQLIELQRGRRRWCVLLR